MSETATTSNGVAARAVDAVKTYGRDEAAVAGVVLGVLASLIPARRSTRLDVLEAIQAT